MNDKMIKEFWGDQLRKFSYDEIQAFGFDPDTEKYLTQVGIPTLEISDNNRFSYCDLLEDLKIGSDQFAIFAEDPFKYFKLGIDLHSREVFLLAKETEENSDHLYYYVNKDIQTYFYCFTIMQIKMEKYPLLYCDHENIEADRQQFAFVREMYDCINAVDNRAVMRGSYWISRLFDFSVNELGNHLDEITELVDPGKYKSDEEAIYAFISGKEKFANQIEGDG